MIVIPLFQVPVKRNLPVDSSAYREFSPVTEGTKYYNAGIGVYKSFFPIFIRAGRKARKEATEIQRAQRGEVKRGILILFFNSL
jgi:hypothetical protein